MNPRSPSPSSAHSSFAFHAFESFTEGGVELKSPPRASPVQLAPRGPRKRKAVDGPPRSASPAIALKDALAKVPGLRSSDVTYDGEGTLRLRGRALNSLRKVVAALNATLPELSKLHIEVPDSLGPGGRLDLGGLAHRGLRILVDGHPEALTILAPASAFGRVHAHDVAEPALLPSHVVYVGAEGRCSKPGVLPGLLHWVEPPPAGDGKLASPASLLQRQQDLARLDFVDEVEFTGKRLKMSADFLVLQWLMDAYAVPDPQAPCSMAPYASPGGLRGHLGRDARVMREALAEVSSDPARAQFDNGRFGAMLAAQWRCMKQGAWQGLIFINRDESVEHHHLACALHKGEDTLGDRWCPRYELRFYDPTKTAMQLRLVETAIGAFAQRRLGHFMGEEPARRFLGTRLAFTRRMPFELNEHGEATVYAEPASLAFPALDWSCLYTWEAVALMRAILRDRPDDATTLLAGTMTAALRYWPDSADLAAGCILESKALDSLAKADLLCIKRVGLETCAREMARYVRTVASAEAAAIEPADRFHVLRNLVDHLIANSAGKFWHWRFDEHLHAALKVIVVAKWLPLEQRVALFEQACEPWTWREVFERSPAARLALQYVFQRCTAQDAIPKLATALNRLPRNTFAAAKELGGERLQDMLRWETRIVRSNFTRMAARGLQELSTLLDLHRAMALHPVDAEDHHRILHRDVRVLLSLPVLGATDKAGLLGELAGGRTAAQQALRADRLAAIAAVICAIWEAAPPQDAATLTASLGVSPDELRDAMTRCTPQERARTAPWLARAARAQESALLATRAERQRAAPWLERGLQAVERSEVAQRLERKTR